MKTEVIKNYLLITPNEELFVDFYTAFKEGYSELKGKHLLLDLLKWNAITTEQLLLFLEIANEHKKNNTSFIIINAAVNIDNVPETLNIAPTLLEAEDILEMEAIQRELGF